MSDSSSEREFTRKRPWVAMLLTVFVPGLGHAYLHLWLRALVWLALYITATAFVLPDSTGPESLSVEAFVAAAEALTVEAALVVAGISLFCLLDAYVMTNQVNKHIRRASSGTRTTCPSCGKELDEDLTFCHWCTTELDGNTDE